MNHKLNSLISKLESLTKSSKRENLSYLKDALSLLNINLDKIKKVHVAGTNGKGSTSLYLTNILMENNLKVGTFLSPYLLSFNERIKINDNNINDHDLIVLLEFIFDFKERFYKLYNHDLAFFELLTLMAFKYFSESNIDVMVIEVGIGGLLDVTNIIDYDVSLITNIGFDHMKQLGSTLESIAENKVGIIKENNHLITTVDSKFHDLFRNYVNKYNGTYDFINPNNIKIVNENPLIINYLDNEFLSPLLGYYQGSNLALAIKASIYLYPNIKFDIIKKGVLNTKHPGRLEKIHDDLYLDGAHNKPAIMALTNSLKLLFKGINIYILFSSLSDKDHDEMLNILSDVTINIILTSFPDFRFKPIINEKYLKIDDPKEALEYIYKNKTKEDIIIVTGSIHFIGYMKKCIINEVMEKRNDI